VTSELDEPKRDAGHPLLNENASSAPRSGEVGVLPVDGLGSDEYSTKLRIAVTCPECSNYGVLEGRGSEYRNVTKMVAPTYRCSVCSWGPTSASDSPMQWRVYYMGRLEGTLLWAVNEEHMEVLVEFLETSPRRRKRVEFGWEFRALMARLPRDITSNRHRNDVVSLLKKLQRTKPRDV
jgi:hypothetical protein